MAADDLLAIYVDGILDVLNLGTNVAVTFFIFARDPETGVVIREPCLRMVRPKQSLLTPNGIIAGMLAEQPDPCRRTDLNS